MFAFFNASVATTFKCVYRHDILHKYFVPHSRSTMLFEQESANLFAEKAVYAKQVMGLFEVNKPSFNQYHGPLSPILHNFGKFSQ